MDDSQRLIHDEVFSFDMEFRNPNWARVVFVGALKMSEERWGAIADLGRSFGEQTLIATVFESLPQYQFSQEADWTFDSMQRIYYHSNVGFLDSHLFGRSAGWGALLLNDLHLLVVASEPPAIQRLMEATGGELALRREYEDFMRDFRPQTDPATIWPR